MASTGKHGTSGDDGQPQGARRRMADKSSPEWATGLKQLYDAVVEEALPDQFLDLLAKLDDHELSPHGRDGSSADRGDAR